MTRRAAAVAMPYNAAGSVMPPRRTMARYYERIEILRDDYAASRGNESRVPPPTMLQMPLLSRAVNDDKQKAVARDERRT